MTPEEFNNALQDAVLKHITGPMNHMIIVARIRTAIRTPWLHDYTQSSKGKKATKRLAMRITDAMNEVDKQ